MRSDVDASMVSDPLLWSNWLSSDDRACKVAALMRQDAFLSLPHALNNVDKTALATLLSGGKLKILTHEELMAKVTPQGKPTGNAYPPESDTPTKPNLAGGNIPDSINVGGDANATTVNIIIQRCRAGNKEMCRFPEQWSEMTRYQEINRFLQTWKYTNQEVYRLLMRDEVAGSWPYDVNTLLGGYIIKPGEAPAETEREFYQVMVPWAMIRRNWRRLIPFDIVEGQGGLGIQDRMDWDYYLARKAATSLAISKREFVDDIKESVSNVYKKVDDALPSFSTTWYFTILVGAGTVLTYALIKT